MKKKIIKLGLLLMIISLLPRVVIAADGLPNSPRFGYGVHVDIWGQNPEDAIRKAGSLNLDWIAIDLDWQRLQPEAARLPSWGKLDAATSQAAQHQVDIMLSITHAPNWAMNPDGPDPQKAANLVAQLAQRYSDVLLALELFPSANTTQGWGHPPNPQAYYDLLKVSTTILQQTNPEIIIVCAGLQPVLSSSEDINDLVFLSELYAVGAKDIMPIVGVRFPPLGNDPLTPNHQADELVLRHYEEIRSLMVENGHPNAIIWVTGFSWNTSSQKYSSDQAAWMKQAYLLFRSQLYIGAAFFNGLNPSKTRSTTLLLPDSNHHPAFAELIQLIALDHNRQTILVFSGLSKKLPRKTPGSR
jgi:hypothetical protein